MFPKRDAAVLNEFRPLNLHPPPIPGFPGGSNLWMFYRNIEFSRNFNTPSLDLRRVRALALSGPQSRFGGQTTRDLGGLCPTRDCSSKKVNRERLVQLDTSSTAACDSIYIGRASPINRGPHLDLSAD